MAKIINIKGDIISNDDEWIYQWMEWEYTCPNVVSRVLEEAAGEDVVVVINSPGGYCDPASEIYSALKYYAGNVEVHIVGLAASAASMIACAGDKVLISQVGLFMIHNAAGSCFGDYRDMESARDSLREYNAALQNAYMDKTGMGQEELQEFMDKTTYMSAAVAVEHGFADGYMQASKDAGDREEPMDGPMDELPRLLGVASAGGHMVSPRVLNKLALAIKGKAADLPTAEAQADAGADLVNISNQEGGNKMDFEELVEKHPELAAEITAKIEDARNEGKEEGIASERARIQQIDSIAASIPGDMVEKAKYTDVKDAAALALELAQKNAAAGQQYMEDVRKDAEESGTEEVHTAPVDNDEGAVLENQLANAANAKKKRK